MRELRRVEAEEQRGDTGRKSYQSQEVRGEEKRNSIMD